MKFKNRRTYVVVIAVVLWLLNIFGLFHSLSHMRVGG
jgi:hypothetical protein